MEKGRDKGMGYRKEGAGLRVKGRGGEEEKCFIFETNFGGKG